MGQSRSDPNLSCRNYNSTIGSTTAFTASRGACPRNRSPGPNVGYVSTRAYVKTRFLQCQVTRSATWCPQVSTPLTSGVPIPMGRRRVNWSLECALLPIGVSNASTVPQSILSARNRSDAESGCRDDTAFGKCRSRRYRHHGVSQPSFWCQSKASKTIS